MATKYKFSIKAVVFLLAAFLLISSSIYAAAWQKQSKAERNEIRRTGQRVTAVAVNRKEIEYVSNRGTIRTKPLVAPMAGTLTQYDSVVAFYDRENPKRVVLEQDDSAFNMTIWIVAAKLGVAGVVLAYFGVKKLRV